MSEPPVALDDIVAESGDERGEVRFEPFDSELLGLAVGRVFVPNGVPPAELGRLLRAIEQAAGRAGYDQLIRRVPASFLDDVWALESSGYLLMDVGITFARRLPGKLRPQIDSDVAVGTATPDDIEQLLVTMLDVPWGSRYEADPAYGRDKVRALQARWLRNSLEGRADLVLIGRLHDRPAGYVTNRLVEEHGKRIGEIDLVGTVPASRGRGVAAAIIDRSLVWFSERVELVTVRTQATNTTASGVYERAGMTLHDSDMTFRLALTPRGGKP